jgi:hypothetical protein
VLGAARLNLEHDFEALVDIVAGRQAPARSRIRAVSAFFSVSAACLFFMEEEELGRIVLEIADDLTSEIHVSSK